MADSSDYTTTNTNSSDYDGNATTNEMNSPIHPNLSTTTTTPTPTTANERRTSNRSNNNNSAEADSAVVSSRNLTATEPNEVVLLHSQEERVVHQDGDVTTIPMPAHRPSTRSSKNGVPISPNMTTTATMEEEEEEEKQEVMQEESKSRRNSTSTEPTEMIQRTSWQQQQQQQPSEKNPNNSAVVDVDEMILAPQHLQEARMQRKLRRQEQEQTGQDERRKSSSSASHKEPPSSSSHATHNNTSTIIDVDAITFTQQEMETLQTQDELDQSKDHIAAVEMVRQDLAAKTATRDAGNAAAAAYASPPTMMQQQDQDHQAAVDMVRQDLAAKGTSSAAGYGPNSSTTSRMQAVATSALRQKGLRSNSNATDTSSAPVLQPQRPPQPSLPQHVPQVPQVPVGAFRIQPAGSGFAVSAASAMEADITFGSSTHGGPNTHTAHHHQTLATISSDDTEPAAVVESFLVEDDEDADDAEARRTRRRQIRNQQQHQQPRQHSRDNSNDASTDQHVPGNTTTSIHSRDNGTEQWEEHPIHSNSHDSATSPAGPTLPEGPPRQPPFVASGTGDDDVIVVEATTPTLDDSVWALLKSRKGRWLILILIGIVATLTVLGVTVFRKTAPDILDNNDNGPKPTDPPTTGSPSKQPSFAPTMEPTMAPTTQMPTAQPTIREFTEDDLPNATLAAIVNDPSSPQAAAWQWLQEDILQRRRNNLFADARQDFPETLPEYQQIVQRFALACLYYATSGAGWQFSRFWLDHATHECDWYPHVTAVSWPYNEGPLVCEPNTGAYRKLLLNNNFLDGTLPEELGLLTDLEMIDVSRNPQLTGSMPQGICQMVQEQQTSNTTELLEDEEEENELVIRITCNTGGLSCAEDCGCQCVS